MSGNINYSSSLPLNLTYLSQSLAEQTISPLLHFHIIPQVVVVVVVGGGGFLKTDSTY